MDTRLLYTIALVIVSVVGGFYYYSGKSHKLDVADDQNLHSTAQHIQVVQTNERGQLYAKVSIAKMTQWMKDGRAELDNLQGTLYEHGQPHATFSAQHARANTDDHEVELAGDVTVAKLADADTPAITFQTERLIGNTQTHQIETTSAVNVQSPQAQFVSQGLNANLNTGQYEFFAIRGKYAPTPP
jgi:lipopolysaccharide export system protein LptC